MFKQFLTLAVALVLLASAIGAETSAPLFPTQSEAMSADAATSSTTPELVEVPEIDSETDVETDVDSDDEEGEDSDDEEDSEIDGTQIHTFYLWFLMLQQA